MQFSKFAILLASASTAIAAPLDLEAGTGNALVGSNALVARQTGAITFNLGIIPGLTGLLGSLLNTLNLGTTVSNLVAILGQVPNGISAAQAQLLAQAQSVLTGLGRQLTAAESALLAQINTALALIGTVPGTLQGTAGATLGQLTSIVGTLPATLQTAITNAIAQVGGVPRINADGSYSIVVTLAFATPQPITPDPSGARNVGNGAGKQFITGACRSTADCAQPACCAGIAGDSSIGICSGLAVGNVAGKTGCGFGDNGSATAPAAAAAAAAASPPPSVAAPIAAPAAGNRTTGGGAAAAPGTCRVDSAKSGSQNVGKGNKSQFITGQCLSKADCASNCCVGQASGAGECRAELVATQAGLSCDFACTA
ncbi:hypothetical protein PpBr36_03763 [Pyricularia pennisetigena]|uniref:hypothetical protein n=1 Tax=Pyricularia pennisetigena TaxID=1578925 RepID=UPI00114FD3E6|nr:hypothetical protein PpBr36_03763 [Pyricularia pennisetigena]TLS31161.1 hypothetical protein PpBr36_03763 [Pyricularia pennisetigena]